MPEEGPDEAAVTLDERSRTLALLVVGVLAAFALLGDSWGVFWFPWPLAIIALVVLLFMTRKDRRSPPVPPPGIRSGGRRYARQPEQWNALDLPGLHRLRRYAVRRGRSGATARRRRDRTYAPRDPRRRGPILFWFTLALIALGDRHPRHRRRRRRAPSPTRRTPPSPSASPA